MEECNKKMSTLQLGSLKGGSMLCKRDNETALQNPTPLVLDKFVSYVKMLYSKWHNLLETTTHDAKPLKSTTEAVSFRMLGNNKFFNKELEDSIHLYSKSIAFAPDGSEELALAYGNRSAALLHTNKLIECLLDINRAMKGKYSENFRRKLLARKETCLNGMRANKQQYVHYEGNEIDPIDATNADVEDRDDEFRSFANFGNLSIPHASPKINLTYNERWGRHIVATKDIEPGEILSSHKFYVISLTEDGMYRNCCYCLARCHALIPCSSCTQMYCSRKCLSRAKELYHGVECELLKYINEPDVELHQPVYFKAHRALFIGTKQGTELRSLMEKLEIRDIFAENVQPRNEPFADDYFTLLILSRTFNSGLLKPNTLQVLKTVVALRRIGFFEKVDNNVDGDGEQREPQEQVNSGSSENADNVVDGDGEQREKQEQDSLSEMELFVVMLLLNHVNTLSINQFEINQFTCSNLNNESCEKTVAGGLVPLHNFINHSCDPNISCFMKKRRRVIFAIRPIRKGEQIFDTYCGSFCDTSLEDRQAHLKSFAFTCQCEACVKKWPMADVLAEKDKLHSITKRKVGKKNTRRLGRGTVRSVDRSSVLAFKREVDSVRKRNFPGFQFLDTAKARREILQTSCLISKWIHANVTKPSFIHIKSEYELTLLIKLLFEESSRKFMSASDMENAFLELLKVLEEYIFHL